MDTIGERLQFCSQGRRGLCFGHIVNLVVKAILFGKLQTHSNPIPEGDILATTEHELWRKNGLVGKLQNLVDAIHRPDVLPTPLRSIQQPEFDASDDPCVRFPSVVYEVIALVPNVVSGYMAGEEESHTRFVRETAECQCKRSSAFMLC